METKSSDLQKLSPERIQNIEVFRQYVLKFKQFIHSKREEEKQVFLDKLEFKAKQLSDKKSLAIIYYFKFFHNFGLLDELQEKTLLTNKILDLSRKIHFVEGEALGYITLWSTYKLQKNIEQARKAREKAETTIKSIDDPIPEIYYWVMYSIAIGKWTEDKDKQALEIMEECREFFKKDESFISEIKSAEILARIYYSLNEKEKLEQLVKEIMMNKRSFDSYSKPLLARYHAMLGKLMIKSSNIELAEVHFFTSSELFNKFGYSGNYVYDYVSELSFLARIYAIKGKQSELQQTLQTIKRIIFTEGYKEKIYQGFLTALTGSLSITQLYFSFLKGKKELNLSLLLDENKKILRDFFFSPEMQVQLLAYSGIKVNELTFFKKKVNLEVYPFLRNFIDFLIEINDPTSLHSEEKIKRAQQFLTEKDVVPSKNEEIFMDLLLAKFCFTSKKFESFKNIIRKYKDSLETITNPCIQILAKSLYLIHEYFMDKDIEKAMNGFDLLIKECEKSIFQRVCEEIKLFKQALAEEDRNSLSNLHLKALLFHDFLHSVFWKQEQVKIEV